MGTIVGSDKWVQPGCPFCGSGNVFIEPLPNGFWALECYTCHARGPRFLSRETAQIRWSVRVVDGKVYEHSSEHGWQPGKLPWPVLKEELT